MKQLQTIEQINIDSFTITLSDGNGFTTDKTIDVTVNKEKETLTIGQGSSFIAINTQMKDLPTEIDIAWVLFNNQWKGYSRNLNNEIVSKGYVLLNSIVDSEALIVIASEETTILSTENEISTVSKVYEKGYTLHGTNSSLDADSIECKENLVLGAVLKLNSDKWSIYIPNQEIENMDNFKFIYPKEGYMVWCYEDILE